MDNIGVWAIAEMEDGFSTVAFVTGTPNAKKALSIMKRKYGKEGTFDENSGEILCGGPCTGHYFTLIWLPIDLRIAFFVDIEQNEFKVGTNLLGADLKLYYLDAEHSNIMKVVPFRLTNEAIADMEQEIKEEKE